MYSILLLQHLFLCRPFKSAESCHPGPVIYLLPQLQEPFRGSPPMFRLFLIQYPQNRTMKRFVTIAKTETTALFTLTGKGAARPNKRLLSIRKHSSVRLRVSISVQKIRSYHPAVVFLLIRRWYFSSNSWKSWCGQAFFTVSSHSEQKWNTIPLYDKNHQRNTDSKKPIILLI